MWLRKSALKWQLISSLLCVLVDTMLGCYVKLTKTFLGPDFKFAYETLFLCKQ